MSNESDEVTAIVAATEDGGCMGYEKVIVNGERMVVQYTTSVPIMTDERETCLRMAIRVSCVDRWGPGRLKKISSGEYRYTPYQINPE